jgi:ankyrin repeat protein
MEPLKSRDLSVAEIDPKMCTICYEKPALDKITVLACEHIFCAPCINAWIYIERKDSCPLCRKKITYENNSACSVAVSRAAAFLNSAGSTHTMLGTIFTSSLRQRPEDERSHAVIWMKDRRTGVTVRSRVPTITRNAREAIELYNSQGSLVEFSVEPLEPNWRQSDSRFDNSARSFAHHTYEHHAFINSDNERDRVNWAKDRIKDACDLLYKSAVDNGQQPPFLLDSALHQGFLQCHFNWNNQSNKDCFIKFAEVVGVNADLDKLNQIVIYVDTQIEGGRLYDEYIPRYFCSYIQIMSGLPLNTIKDAFAARGYDYALIAKNSPSSLICNAALAGDLGTTEQLFIAGEKLDSINADGLMPLHCAVKSGNIELVKFLLNTGSTSTINWRNKSIYKISESALHLAVQGGYEKITTLLLEAGANINIVNREGDTPLHVACRSGNVKLIQILLERGANAELRNHPKKSSRNQQTAHDLVYCYDSLIQPLFGVNVSTAIAERDGWMEKAVASAKHSLAELQQKYASLSTPQLLELAAKDLPNFYSYCCQHPEATHDELLVALRTIVNEPLTYSWQRHISNAIWRGDSELTYRLIKYGAEILPDLLEDACTYGVHRYNRTLKREGNHYEKKPLHSDFLILAEMLLAEGAQVNVQNKDGKNVLYQAVHESRLTMAWYLLQQKADCNMQDNEGNTALHVARHPELVEILLAAGADPTIKNKQGKLASDLAAEKKNKQSLALLMRVLK